MSHRKRVARHSATTATKPTHFFQKELTGEEPPSAATIEILYDLAAELFDRHPWDLLAEDNLVLVKAGASGELCFCSIMGALGQVRALHAYMGPEGYHFFQKLRAGTTITAGEFFAAQRTIYVEFAPLNELTVPDRNLLKVMGHPLKKGTLAPIFRSIRPGYFPWYVTEGEARILAECQLAFIALCDRVQANQDFHYWEKENVYPLLSLKDAQGNKREYEISLVAAPNPVQPLPQLPNLDETRIQRIRNSGYPSQGVFEVDHFYGAGMIGEKNERKACIRMAMAINAESGFAYPPEVSLPSASTGDLLASVVSKAIETAHTLPREIHVKDGEFKLLLEPLAQALGISVRAQKSLPALDFFKAGLMKSMGDPGPIPF